VAQIAELTIKSGQATLNQGLEVATPYFSSDLCWQFLRSMARVQSRSEGDWSAEEGVAELIVSKALHDSQNTVFVLAFP